MPRDPLKLWGTTHYSKTDPQGAMIDEELYQQAADELNSDKRRPHIWARACALASDDHDEARFLYTNLRVEELQAERKQSASNEAESIPTIDSTLALEPLTDDSVMEFDDFEGDPDADDLPSSVPAPSGIDRPLNQAADDERLGLLPVSENTDVPESLERTSFEDQFSVKEPVEQPGEAASDQFNDSLTDPLSDPLNEIHSNALSQVASETNSASGNLSNDLDDSFAGGDDTIDVFQQEIAAVKAEQGDRDTFLDTGAFSRALDSEDERGDSNAELNASRVNNEHDDTDLELDRTTELDMNAEELADLTHPEVIQSSAYHSPELTQSSELNDKSRESLDAMLSDDYEQGSSDTDGVSTEFDNTASLTNTLDEVLEDAHYEPPSPVNPKEDSMEWLDESFTADSTADAQPPLREPTIYEDDPLSDELERQAREMPIAEEPAHASVEQDFPTLTTTDSKAIPAAPSLDDVPEKAAASASSGAIGSAAAAAMVVAGASATTAGQHAMNRDQAEALPTESQRDETDHESESLFPLDLTEGGHGRQYAVYRRNYSAQAVKQGVSWSALIMTLPYLIYRHLFGTAILYSVLWLITLGGLIISGLAWIDAGAAAEPIIKTCTICFGLLAFIGLVYLPFMHGNRWRRERLENRGYELIAFAKARSPGKAIARVRAASGFE